MSIFAEEYYDFAEEYYEEEYFEHEEYYDHHPGEEYFDHHHEEEYFEEEYYDEEFYDEETEELETETEKETERGKVDPEYGADEYHERRKPEDGFRIRKNPKESKFEDFKLLTKDDADKYFNLVYYHQLPDKVELDVKELLQRPELPTGCETIALTAALRYEGFDLLKTTIAAEFLLYNLRDENAAIGFIGDPFNETGAGCFAPALAATADNFFIDQGYTYRAFDLTGSTLDELLCYVAAGTPVMVWTTMFMEPVEFTGEHGRYDGHDYNWYKSEHCVLLTGYDLDKDTLTVNDPMEGIVTRDFYEFEEIYDKIGQYAVVVKDLEAASKKKN